MAGLGGPKVLLLWAGLLGLARCQSSGPIGGTQTAPNCTYSVENIKHDLRINIPRSNTSDPDDYVISLTDMSGNKSTYTVENTTPGSEINITRSTTSDPDYVIRLTKMPGNRWKFKDPLKCTSIQSSNPPVNSTLYTLSCPIYMLKPCTNYSVMVELGNEICKLSDKKPFHTGQMVENDIYPNTECVPGYLCYESKWDISDTIQPKKASIQTCNNTNHQCIKLTSDDFCSELKTNFSCFTPNVIKTPITLDLFERSSVEIEIKTSNKLPLQPNWTNKPKNCSKSIELDYSCQGPGASNVTISMLEPYTRYNCTGRVKLNNQTTNNTKSFLVNVECRLNITLSSPTQSNTSISLSWETTSENCPHEHLLKLSYNGCCTQVNGKTECYSGLVTNSRVEITGLEPYKDHTCYVIPHYNRQPVPEKTSYPVDLKTKPGIPGKVEISSLILKENNHYEIKCSPLQKEKYNGKSITYIAFLDDGQKRNNSNCQFDFKDLSYSTTYTLTVFAFNGEFNSTPSVKHIVTRYNDNAALWILGFLIILNSLTLIFYTIYLLYRKKLGYVHDRCVT